MNHHFVTFVNFNNEPYELDGYKSFPKGHDATTEDFFLKKKYVKMQMHATRTTFFSASLLWLQHKMPRILFILILTPRTQKCLYSIHMNKRRMYYENKNSLCFFSNIHSLRKTYCSTFYCKMGTSCLRFRASI